MEISGHVNMFWWLLVVAYLGWSEGTSLHYQSRFRLEYYPEALSQYEQLREQTRGYVNE